MRRFPIVAAATLLALASWSIPGLAQTVLRAGHISPKDSAEGAAVDKFAELVGQKTGGAVTVQVFPSEQLGSAVSQIESTIIGNQDIYVGGSVEFERYSDGLKILGINWVIPSAEAFRKVTSSPLWDELLVTPLKNIGVTALASNWERGYRVMVSTKPITSIDDMKGLKFRIAPIDTWRRVWTAVGTQPVVLAWTDVYLGMKQGTVEAVTSPIALVAPMKFTEVAKHVVRTDELWVTMVPVVNSAKFAALSADQQKAVRDAAAEAGDWFVAEQERRVAADIEAMTKNNGATFSTIDLAPGVELMKPVVLQMESEGTLPKGLFDRVVAVWSAP